MKKVRLALLGVLLVGASSCKKTEKMQEAAKEKVWMVSTYAGANTPNYVDGEARFAAFQIPTGLAVDPTGNVYVADKSNHCIRKISTDGQVSTFAGKGLESGYVEGTGNAARFNQPSSIVIDAAGNLYVADSGNSVIRKITSSGVVTTFVGSTYGFADGNGTSARFANPTALSIDASNNMFVADTDNLRLRKITPDGNVVTIAGTGQGGTTEGPATTSRLNPPIAIAVNQSGEVYFMQRDFTNLLRKVTSDGMLTTVSRSVIGYANGYIEVAQFGSCQGMTFDSHGNLYITDVDNGVIRKVTFINGKGYVNTFAGIQAPSAQRSPLTWYGDGPALQAKFSNPIAIAIDLKGENVYFSDASTNLIKKISFTDDPTVTTNTPAQDAQNNWNKPNGWK